VNGYDENALPTCQYMVGRSIGQCVDTYRLAMIVVNGNSRDRTVNDRELLIRATPLPINTNSSANTEIHVAIKALSLSRNREPISPSKRGEAGLSAREIERYLYVGSIIPCGASL
jgi:hypothetical protein